MMIEILLSIAKNLFDLREGFSKFRHDRRERAATLLVAIAECVEDIAGNVRTEQRVPEARCSELNTYLRSLDDILAPTFPKEDVVGLLKTLKAAQHRRVTMYDQISGPLVESPSVSQAKIREGLRVLDEASGIFRAIANLLKAR